MTRRSVPLGPDLTPAQAEAIRTAMRVFVEDDLTRDISPTCRTYCDVCRRARPAAGALRYDRYQFCNDCATQYEIAHTGRPQLSAGQFVRDTQFGEAEA